MAMAPVHRAESPAAWQWSPLNVGRDQQHRDGPPLNFMRGQQYGHSSRLNLTQRTAMAQTDL